MTKRMVTALLALTAIGAFAEGGPVRKKLIGHSWDLSAMGAERIAQNASLFENGALDGVSLNAFVEATVDGGKSVYPTSVIMDWPFACTREMMAPHVGNFRKISQSKTLTDNFLNTFHGPKKRYDWNDDARWNRLKESLRTMAWAARAGGLRGILMDQEDYSRCRQFFRLPDDPPYDELCALVRRRAHELFGAMFGEFPDMTVISFWWLALDSDMMTAGDPRSLARAKGALWPAFVNGVLDVMPDTARLVEGDEWAYRDRAADGDFLKRAIWHKNLISLVDPANRRKFRANVLSGFGLYLDMYVRGEPVPPKDRKDIRRQYVHASEDGSHLRAFAHNLTQAAEAADEYVWLFACHSQTGTGAFVPWKGTGLGAWDNRPWIEDHLNGFTDICRAVKEPEVWRAERLARLKAAGKAVNAVRPEKRTANRDLAAGKEADIDVIQVWPVKVGDFYSVEFTVEGEIQPIVRWWDTAYGGRPLTVANVPVVVDGTDATRPRLAHALVRIPEGVTALDLCLRAEPSKVPARYSNVEIVKIFDFSDVKPAVDTLGPLQPAP